MENFDWMDMMKKMQDIRLFSSLNVRRIKNGGITSSQELNILSQIILSNIPLTPMDLTSHTGMSKSAVSRLIENLQKKGFLIKQYNSEDKRSYTLYSTEKGNQELENAYRHYLAPIYKLRRSLGEEQFEALMTQIREANRVLQKPEVNYQ